VGNCLSRPCLLLPRLWNHWRPGFNTISYRSIRRCRRCCYFSEGISNSYPHHSLLLQRTVIGSTDATFVSKYGKPIARKITSSGATEEIFDTGNTKMSEFDVYLKSGTNLVYGIVISTPVDRPWGITTGIALCNFYLPSDTVLGKPRIITTSNGVQLYYREGSSAALATSIDPPYFFDGGNRQLVKPGTINASYYYADPQGFTISLCALSFGTTADVK
jgi:hypothetical protein